MEEGEAKRTSRDAGGPNQCTPMQEERWEIWPRRLEDLGTFREDRLAERERDDV